ncbi:alpha/beta hydrolase [Streptomyces sp. NPDC004111]|uniref:alpha/beta hydrolase n=1 Tax=Streptomyces sp. NPDC004111 TaxID=3364690 RepID=UPI0036B143CF
MPSSYSAPQSAPQPPRPTPGSRQSPTPPPSAAFLGTLTRWARRPFWEAPDASWVVRRWPTLAGVLSATAFFWFSLTPSLLPRPWYFQGLIGGITAATGYALGAVAGRLLRPVVARRFSDRARVRCWQVYYPAALVVSTAAVSWSAHAQRRLRTLQGLEPSLVWHTPMIMLIAIVVCTLLVLVARSVRLLARTLIRWCARWVPQPVAYTAGLLATTLLVVVFSKNVLYERGFIGAVDRISRTVNLSMADHERPPDSAALSGSPRSLVRWKELGAEGRKFISETPTRQDIAAFTGRPAEEPVRVYVGEAVGPEDFRAAADIAVRELERTGAFDRRVIALVGTTGSGWVDRWVVEPLEYMYGGDTAIAAVQYSYLPSWISFLVDKEKAARASRALYEAVHAKWATLPADSRPKLVVSGESLGAYAVEASFGNLDDLLAGTDGALLVGPPHASPIRREIAAGRDEGSPVWRPEYDRGRHVRVAQFPREDLARPTGPWDRPRVVYLQNASDPVVWWTPDLLFSRPAWLRDPLGPDVTDEIDWVPLATFWQVTVDLAVSFDAPPPHGHRYGTNAVEGWAAVVPPQGWTDADTARLKKAQDARRGG